MEEYLALQRTVHRIAEAVRQEVNAERVYLLSLGSNQGNAHVHWHIVPLPPGVPYREQQLKIYEQGILKIPEEEMAALAARLAKRIGQLTGAAGKQGTADTPKIESLIAKKTNGAFLYGVLSIFGFTALIACPLAYLYATQALRLMDQHHVGERFRDSAKRARTIAAGVFLFYAAITCACTSIFVLVSR